MSRWLVIALLMLFVFSNNPAFSDDKAAIIPMICNNCESVPPFDKMSCNSAFEQIVIDLGHKNILLQLLGTHWGEIENSVPLSGDHIDCNISSAYEWQCNTLGEGLAYEASMKDDQFSMKVVTGKNEPTRIKRCALVHLQ